MPMVVDTFYFYTDENMQRSIQHHRELIMAISGKDQIFAQHVMTVRLRVAHGIYMKNRRNI